eukprot:PhM_4_TR10033/c1_g1_i3/m.38848
MDPVKELELLKARVEDLDQQLSAPGVCKQERIAIRQQIFGIHQVIAELWRHIPIPPATAQPVPGSGTTTALSSPHLSDPALGVSKRDKDLVVIAFVTTKAEGGYDASLRGRLEVGLPGGVGLTTQWIVQRNCRGVQVSLRGQYDNKKAIADCIDTWRANGLWVEEQGSNWTFHRDKLCSSVKHTKKAEGFCLRDTQGSGKTN